jgi:heat shock protein HspQ
MSYHIQYREDIRLVIVNLNTDFNFSEEIQGILTELLAYVGRISYPIYFLVNVSQLQFSMTEIMVSTNMLAGSSDAPLHHPQIKKLLWVVGNMRQQMVAQGLQSEAFGYTNLEVFTNLDDAIAYAETN